MKPRQERERPKSHKDKRDKIVDLTGIKPVKRRNSVRSGLGDYSSSSSNNNDAVLFCIPENSSKGLEKQAEDDYAKYNQLFDGFADEQLIASGATILHSHFEITDSSGQNRTLVRRDDDDYR